MDQYCGRTSGTVLRMGGSQVAYLESFSTPFEDFYRGDYRLLLKVALVAGASWDQAQDAVDQAMEDVLRRWPAIEHPRAYARRAVLSHVVKQKKRDQERLPRMLRGGHLVAEACEDQDLTVWEDAEWVSQTLKSLPSTQREIMEYVVEGLSTTEISELLGKTPAAVRKNVQLARQKLKRGLRPDGTPRHDEVQARPEPSVRSGKEARWTPST
jgi:RNA polymerase sigma factor (sigma-70 family)